MPNFATSSAFVETATKCFAIARSSRSPWTSQRRADAGEHQFLGGSAAILEFRETTHLDVVYLEGLAGDYYEEQPSEVARYREEFSRLSAKALDPASSIKIIQSLLDM